MTVGSSDAATASSLSPIGFACSISPRTRLQATSLLQICQATAGA